MGNKALESTASVLQNFITEGRKLFFKEKEPMFVEIRFNHNDVDGTRKWRVIFNKKEFYSSEIFIEIPCKTESKFYEDLGGYKHHIVCNANIIFFKDNICTIK